MGKDMEIIGAVAGDAVKLFEYIDRDHLVEREVMWFDTDASQLGWRPGHLPKHFKVGPEKFGNGQPFELLGADEHAFQYRQMFGSITIVIYND